MSRGCPARQYEEYTSRLPLRLACRPPVINNMTLTCTFCVPPGTSCPGEPRVNPGCPTALPWHAHCKHSPGRNLILQTRRRRFLPFFRLADQELVLFDQSFAPAGLTARFESVFFPLVYTRVELCLIRVNT